MENELDVTPVPRALETKSRLFGFELPDLLLIFMTLAATNLVFGATKYRYPLVWGLSLGLAAFRYFAKRGKPDGYLQHLGEFIVKPRYLSAGGRDVAYRRFKGKE